MATRALSDGESALQRPNKRGYTYASAATKAYLEEFWKTNNYPTAEDYDSIAAHVGDRTVDQIRVWFQGRRKKRNRVARESGLPSPTVSTTSPSDPNASFDSELDEEEILFPELISAPEFGRLQQLVKKCPNPSERRIQLWLRALKLEELSETVTLWIQWTQEQDEDDGAST